MTTGKAIVKIHDYSSAPFVKLHESEDLTGWEYGGHEHQYCAVENIKRISIDLHSPLSVNRRQAESGPDPRWPELFNPLPFLAPLASPLHLHTAPGC